MKKIFFRLKGLKVKSLLLIVGLMSILVTTSIYLAYKSVQPKKEIDINHDIDVSADTIYRKVYLLSDKGLVVPLTVGFEKKDDLAQELVYVSSLLKSNSPLVKGKIKPVLSENVKIKNLTLDSKVLTVDFSEEFNQYDVKVENRILEALVWTYSQYSEINSVQLEVEGNLLTHMPQGKTYIPTPLNKTIGINNHIFHREINTASVITYFETKLNNDTVYVPVTHGVKVEGSILETVSKSLSAPVSLYSGLTPIKKLAQLEIVSVKYNEELKLEIELKPDALLDETSVSKELYDLIVIHFSQIDQIVGVSVIVEGEVMQISGYPNQDEIKVSSVIYNQIKL